MCYAFSVNTDALLEPNYFRLTTTADMDVNCGRCMIVVQVIFVPHGKRQWDECLIFHPILTIT